MSGRQSRSWAWVVGIVVVALAFRTLFDPRKILAIGDLAFFHLPLRTLLAEAWAEGFPWWNAALHGGQPILSNPNYAAFYPPTWLAFLLPPTLAVQLTLLLHAAWAYAGSWRLARSLDCRPWIAVFAAVAFTAGGAFVSSATLLTLFCGLAWTPWILLWAGRLLEARGAAWRRDSVLVGVGLAAQLFAGEPVNCILSGLALLGLVIDGATRGRKTAARLGASVALALLLAGVQLTPTAGRLAASPRGGGIDRESAGERSMPPARLLEWALPHPLGDPMRIDDELFFGQSVHDKGFPYLISIYPGFLVLVLALGALGRTGLRWRWAWTLMMVGGVALALGRHNPLYEWIVPWLPVLDQTRYPEKLLLLATSALPFVAALGWETRTAKDPSQQSGRFDVAMLLTALAVVGLTVVTLLLLLRPEGVVWLATTLRTTPLPPASEAALMSWARTEALLSLLVAAGGCALLVFGRRRPAGRGRWRRVELVLLALLALDLLRNDWNLLPVAPQEAVSKPAAVLAGQPTEGRLFTDLMFSPDAQIPLRYERPGPLSFWNGVETLEPYLATLWGYSYALHHDYDLMLTRPARLALEAFIEDWKIRYLGLRFAGAWGVETIALHRPIAEVLRDRFDGRPEPRMRLEANPYRLREFRLVPEVRLFESQLEALEAARDGEYVLRERGYWVRASAAETATTTQGTRGAELSLISTKWSHLRLRTRSDGPAFVQIARTWDAGWSSRVNAEETPTYLTATGQMGLRVPAGEHTIEMRYFDPLVPLGALLSLLGLAISTWMWRRDPGVGSRNAPIP